MVDYDYLCEHLGADAANSVAQRHQGGINNLKGNDFEVRFAVFLVAKHAQSEGATIAKQVYEFVDDLQITYPGATDDGAVKTDYQMKDRQTIPWSELQHDFMLQNALNKAKDIESSVQVVVVSSPDLEGKLTKNMPEDIASHSEAHSYQNATANRILMESDEVREVVKGICAFPDEPDKLENVFSLLTASWLDQPTNSRVLVDTVIEDARKLNPAFLRVDGEWEIPDEVSSVLNNIKGFTYDIEYGFFKWSFGRSMTGWLPYSCNDQKFDKFLQLIAKHSPSSFDLLEPHLN